MDKKYLNCYIMQNYKWRNIMKKQTILAFTTALGIAMSVSAPVEAASANRVNISVYEKDCTTNQWNSVETGSINDVLKKYVIVSGNRFTGRLHTGNSRRRQRRADTGYIRKT